MWRRYSFLLLAGLLLNLSARAETPKNTRQLLEQFGDDVATVWTDFPKDNQKSVRDAKGTDLNNAFNRDIVKADAPPNLTVQKAIDNCISELAKTRILLKFDKMQLERTMYMNNCAAALRREVPLAIDYNSPRTTQQCFDMMLELVKTAREKLHVYPVELQQAAYTAINAAITDILRTATVQEKPDKNVQMDLNIKEARRIFPTSSPELEQSNRSVLQLLEAMAKTIQQIDRKK